MGKKKNNKAKKGTDLFELVDASQLFEKTEVINIPEKKQNDIDTIDFDEMLPAEPPFYLYMVDFSNNVNQATAEKILEEQTYVSMAQEECAGVSFKIEFATKNDLIRAYGLDGSVIYGKKLKMSFLRYDKIQEIRMAKFSRNDPDAMPLISLNFRDGPAVQSQPVQPGFENKLMGLRGSSDSQIASAQPTVGLSNFRNSQPVVQNQPQSTAEASINTQVSLKGFRSSDGPPAQPAMPQAPIAGPSLKNLRNSESAATAPTPSYNPTSATSADTGLRNFRNTTPEKSSYQPTISNLRSAGNSDSRNPQQQNREASSGYVPSTNIGNFRKGAPSMESRANNEGFRSIRSAENSASNNSKFSQQTPKIGNFRN